MNTEARTRKVAWFWPLPESESQAPAIRPESPASAEGEPSLQPATKGIVSTLLSPLEQFVTHVGALSLLFARTLPCVVQRPFELRETLRQIERLGVASVGLVIATSTVLGMVMATQFAFGLRKFGGMEYTSRVVALSFAQELAPTFIGIIVGGRIGAGIAAQLGAMAVTEQIDAIRALGANPLKKLVAPRLLACVTIMPLLSTISLVLGFLAAMLLVEFQFGIPAYFFLSSALQSLTMEDFLSGLIKTPVFGVIIACVACHLGMDTRGGTEGVGGSTTKTVVVTAITLLCADLLLTQLGYILWPMR